METQIKEVKFPLKDKFKANDLKRTLKYMLIEKQSFIKNFTDYVVLTQDEFSTNNRHYNS